VSPTFDPGGTLMDVSDKEILILKGLKTPKKAKELTELGFSKSTVYRLLKRLENKRLIKKENGHYHITLLGKRTLESLDGAIRVHAGKVVLIAYDLNLFVARQKGREVKMKNWDAYYLDLAKYGVDATVQINVAEKTTVVVHLPEFRANDVVHAVLIVQNVIAKVRRALELEGIITEEAWLDFSLRFVYAEYGFKLPENDPSEAPYEVRFGYDAVDLLGNELNTEAKAWIDESVGKELETNDSVYAYKRIMEPIWVERIDRRTTNIESVLVDCNLLLSQINESLENLRILLDRFDRSLGRYGDIYRNWNEMINSFTKAEIALSENIMKHIELVSSVSGYADEFTKGLKIYNSIALISLIASIFVFLFMLVLLCRWYL